METTLADGQGSNLSLVHTPTKASSTSPASNSTLHFPSKCAFQDKYLLDGGTEVCVYLAHNTKLASWACLPDICIEDYQPCMLQGIIPSLCDFKLKVVCTICMGLPSCFASSSGLFLVSIHVLVEVTAHKMVTFTFPTHRMVAPAMFSAWVMQLNNKPPRSNAGMTYT